MAISDDTIKADFVQVGCLELEHLVDARFVDQISGSSHLVRRMISTTEAGDDKFRAVLLQEIKGGQMRTSRDLDELSESVTDLSFRQRSQEGEIQERLDGGMIRS